jgi:NADP-dependent 3-hydroxy acid dehydrogenase YdfG
VVKLSIIYWSCDIKLPVEDASAANRAVNKVNDKFIGVDILVQNEAQCQVLL